MPNVEHDHQQQPPAYTAQTTYPAAGYPGGPPLQQMAYPPGQYPPGQQYPPPQGYPAPQQGYPAPQQGYVQPPNQYGNVVVQQQPYYAGHVQTSPPPPDHMTSAILATLCCFWPTGIIAIMRASDARAATARGDNIGANTLAQSAKKMINISICLGIVTMIMCAVIFGLYFGYVLNSINDFDDDY